MKRSSLSLSRFVTVLFFFLIAGYFAVFVLSSPTSGNAFQIVGNRVLLFGNAYPFPPFVLSLFDFFKTMRVTLFSFFGSKPLSSFFAESGKTIVRALFSVFEGIRELLRELVFGHM